MGGPRRYTRAQLIAESGLERDMAVAMWRSLGFAEVGDDEVVFTAGDRAALRQLGQLREAGLVPADVQDAVARRSARRWPAWRLADRDALSAGRLRPSRGERARDAADRRPGHPAAENMQSYVWRRHVAAAATRLLSTMPGESDTRTLTVGFADLVGFTRATRRLSPAEFDRADRGLPGHRRRCGATCRGRVVKTVGDEVLFVADDAPNGAEIALELVERLAESSALPRLRIGLAVGDVVTRFGDVYGEAVNIAARLTTHARPGRILVDRNLAAALEHDSRFELRTRRPVAVRGYRHLQQWSWPAPTPEAGPRITRAPFRPRRFLERLDLRRPATTPLERDHPPTLEDLATQTPHGSRLLSAPARHCRRIGHSWHSACARPSCSGCSANHRSASSVRHGSPRRRPVRMRAVHPGQVPGSTPGCSL